MTTFQNQKELKNLPIPELSSTCRSYLEVLKPLQTEREHSETIQAVDKFLQGAGPILDQQLREYAKTRDSYIEQFWFDSYLNYDSPVVLNLNPFILLEDDPTPLQSTQVSRAASLTTSSLRFVRALRKNELPADKLKNGTPLDMDQYPKLFGSARIPSLTGCILQTDPSSRHVVVLSKSQFYWFDVLDGNDNLMMTENDIKLNYKAIIYDSEQTSAREIAKSGFGILTTENRRVWAQLRSSIQKDAVSSELLNIIDSALFVVCLDHVSIEDLKDLAKNYLCGTNELDHGVQVGTCTNRWYDKLQIIVTKNAKAGINFEHTGVDGHTVLRFASDIYTDSILRFAKSINHNSPSLWSSVSPVPPTKDARCNPRRLEWNLTNQLSLALRFGETRLSDLIQQNEFEALEYKSYGMEMIKKMGMSPDAFVQMSFQAAYYALYGKVECTYEPAMTKHFLHGRTEAIRSVSLESNDFVTSLFDMKVSSEQKLAKLRKACQKHSSRTRDCSKGMGQDRHLYALFCIWKRYFSESDEMGSNETDLNDSDDESKTLNSHSPAFKESISEIPSIFADSGWDKLNNSVLSTSNCGNPSLKMFGFGPVTSSGFGIGYIIKDNSVSICASSKHRQTKRFLDTLKGCLDELFELYLAEERESENLTTYVSTPLAERGRDAVPRSKAHLTNLLGGYDYFDIGPNGDNIKSRGTSPTPSFARAGSMLKFSTREIGKKLRLAEY